MVLKQKTASLSLILAVSALLVTTSVPTEARLAPASSGESKDEGYLSRRAERLQKRVTLQYGITPSIPALMSALKERQRLLRTTIAVRFLHEPVAGVASPDLWHVSLQRYPTWLTFHADRQHPSFQISQEIIKEELLDQYPTELRPPSDAAILSTKDDAYVTRADTDDFVRPGFVFDVHQAAVKLAKALDHHATHLTLSATYESGRYYLVAEEEITQLTMLSSGRSNFAKSPSGRRSNIRKALEQHLDHVLVPAGATFSFNETLETSIDGSEGWALSLIIVNGKDLQMAPGGGICQAATTAFRAVLLAGLPVLQRSNHSLYVSYYKDFGIGIDAAVYPGQQDFTFVNDTGNPLVFQSWTEGDDAFVQLYGVPDGRTVELEGPYFASTAPEDFRVKGRVLQGNEIGWKSRVRYQDNREREEIIVSRYLALPRTLAAEYTDPAGKSELVPESAPTSILQAAQLSL